MQTLRAVPSPTVLCCLHLDSRRDNSACRLLPQRKLKQRSHQGAHHSARPSDQGANEEGSSASKTHGVNTAGLRLRLVDAKEQVVGRLASQLSAILQGKDKPTYSPERDQGDVVIVKNARHVEFTGKKWDQKLYRWHTGFPGGLKERPAKLEHAKDPTSVLRRAVYGMLPKNKLRKERARKLRIFPDEEHPFTQHPQLVPWEMAPRRRRVNEPLFELPEGFEPLNSTAYRKRFEHMLQPEVMAEVVTQSDAVIPAAEPAPNA